MFGLFNNNNPAVGNVQRNPAMDSHAQQWNPAPGSVGNQPPMSGPALDNFMQRQMALQMGAGVPQHPSMGGVPQRQNGSDIFPPGSAQQMGAGASSMQAGNRAGGVGGQSGSSQQQNNAGFFGIPQQFGAALGRFSSSNPPAAQQGFGGPVPGSQPQMAAPVQGLRHSPPLGQGNLNQMLVQGNPPAHDNEPEHLLALRLSLLSHNQGHRMANMGGDGFEAMPAPFDGMLPPSAVGMSSGQVAMSGGGAMDGGAQPMSGVEGIQPMVPGQNEDIPMGGDHTNVRP
jgi:hypothetical protein